MIDSGSGERPAKGTPARAARSHLRARARRGVAARGVGRVRPPSPDPHRTTSRPLDPLMLCYVMSVTASHQFTLLASPEADAIRRREALHFCLPPTVPHHGIVSQSDTSQSSCPGAPRRFELTIPSLIGLGARQPREREVSRRPATPYIHAERIYICLSAVTRPPQLGRAPRSLKMRGRRRLDHSTLPPPCLRG